MAFSTIIKPEPPEITRPIRRKPKAVNVNLLPKIKTSGITHRDRMEYLALAREDELFRADFDALCSLNVIFYASCVLWIFEPREAGENRDVPFIPRPFQETFLLDLEQAIREGYDLFVEKTREMGVTWCVLIKFHHSWMFETAFTAKLGSYTRDMIDKKDDEDALFAKLDYLVQSVKIDAPWLYPKGYRPVAPWRTFMKMKNPWTRSILTGQAPTGRFGRGGRQRAIMLDEFQEWAFQDRSYTSCSKTTNCRIIVGTPNGPHNLYAKLASPDKRARNRIKSDIGRKPRKKITLHWLIDPTKNKYELYNTNGKLSKVGHGVPEVVPHGWKLIYPWYEEQKDRFDYDTTKLAQEIDIDYNRSTQGAMYPHIERCGMYEFIPFQPDLETYAVIDFGVDDACCVGWFQYNKWNHRWSLIDWMERNGKSIYFYIPLIRGDRLQVGLSHGETYHEEDMAIFERHRGWFPYYTGFYGDPAGKQRNPVTATSVISALRDNEIYCEVNDKARGFEERYNACRHFLPLLDINMKYCEQAVEYMRGARWQPRGDGDTNTSPRKPVHDSTAHTRSMMEYMAVCNPHAIDPQMPTEMRSVTAEDIPSMMAVFGDLKRLQAEMEGAREAGNWNDRSGYGVG